MSNYGSGSERKAVLDAFAWEAKVALITRSPTKSSLIYMIPGTPEAFFHEEEGESVGEPRLSHETRYVGFLHALSIGTNEAD
jgi:hypothetical protein